MNKHKITLRRVINEFRAKAFLDCDDEDILTFEEIAQKCLVSATYFNKVISGSSKLTPNIAVRISNVIGVGVEELIAAHRNSVFARLAEIIEDDSKTQSQESND